MSLVCNVPRRAKPRSFNDLICTNCTVLLYCNAGHILRILDGNRHFDPQLKLGDAILAFLKEAKDNENTVNLGDVKTAIRDAGDL